MLVLERKVGEWIRIGDDIEVYIVSVRGKRVRIGIQAPPDTPITRDREEPPVGRCELTEIEATIEREIELGLNQVAIAKTYALAVRSTYPTDWHRVNAAIIVRWSEAGLQRIKRLAWSGRCFDEPR